MLSVLKTHIEYYTCLKHIYDTNIKIIRPKYIFGSYFLRTLEHIIFQDIPPDTSSFGVSLVVESLIDCSAEKVEFSNSKAEAVVSIATGNGGTQSSVRD